LFFRHQFLGLKQLGAQDQKRRHDQKAAEYAQRIVQRHLPDPAPQFGLLRLGKGFHVDGLLEIAFHFGGPVALGRYPVRGRCGRGALAIQPGIVLFF
jgi:hypothetical protein